jgi:hypothetical protein
MKFQGTAEWRLSLRPHDEPMTWLIISMPIMLLAIAIAVLPVLLMSISEARRNSETSSDLTGRPGPSTVIVLRHAGAGQLVQKGA